MANLIKYQENVIGSLINNAFLDVPLLVKLSRQQVALISSATQSCRPKHRLVKGLALRETTALLLPDYCSHPLPMPTGVACRTRKSLQRLPRRAPVLSVEIKPKQGFVSPHGLPVSAFCLKQTDKVSTCRFAL